MSNVHFPEHMNYEWLEWWEEVLKEHGVIPTEIFNNGLKHPDARRDPHREKMLDHKRRGGECRSGSRQCVLKVANRKFRYDMPHSLSPEKLDAYSPVPFKHIGP